MSPNPFKTMLETVMRKPTTAPDGRTDSEAAAAAISKKTSLGHDMLHMSPGDALAAAQAIVTIASGKPLDDKKLMLEHGVSMLQSLPLNSGMSATVSNDFIAMLYHDMPHPPPMMVGPASKYRKNDGSGNNPWMPDMGKAGSPYARSVAPLKNQGPGLPDPELVFDLLLKRTGVFRPHPSGLNRLFFSFATIVIHECFQTSRTDPWINSTSSYVDLSTIYGNNGKEQERVRTYNNGLIYPDSIASAKIMMMPPGVIAVLLLFSRNHNDIAKNMLAVNEEGKYKPWDTLSEEQKKWQDEDIFQVSRNINVGYFASVVLHDYVSAILNTPRANSTWNMDLGAEIKQMGKRVERGTGNVVSIEFAVLYHWHAALSAGDDKWMLDVLKASSPEIKTADDVTPELFQDMIKQQGHRLMSIPAREWTFGGLKRGKDGRFSDFELAEVLKDCIEEPAHAFGAHGTPSSMKIVEIMGQLQARDTFNVCTMNEFRRYLNLQEYKSFEEWNPDKETARAAELLYGHIENLELYPGLMAECTKPAMPGSGVCPGQTTGRGILDDAVALVRGDRFLSHDFNSTTLTNWGFAKLGQLPPGAYGGMLPYLIFNGLPGAWTGTSSYALLPFYTPTAAKGILKANKVIQLYDTERPASDATVVVGIHTHEGCKKVFEDRENFRVMYQKAIRECTDGHDFLIGWDDAKRHDPRSDILHKVFFEENFEVNVTKFFRTNVAKLIQQSSLKYANGTRRSVNIVRDVCNVTPILWLAERFAIPLKTAEFPHGLVSIPEAFGAYLILFMYQSFNIIPANEWLLREKAMEASAPLRQIFKTHLMTQKGLQEGLVDWLAKGSTFEVGPDADRIYHALNATKLPIGDLIGDCIGMGAPVAGNITQQASILIDLFLSEGYEKYKERIIQLAHLDDPASERELQGFVWEGMRHAPVVPGLPRVAANDMVFKDGAHGDVHIRAGQTVLIATSAAGMDPKQFPNPEIMDPHRPFKDYLVLGHGLHYCFGARLVGASIAATLKEVFRLKNVRRAAGPQGHFTIVEHEFAGIKMRKYLDDNAVETPIPTTLTLEYDV